MTLQRKQTPQVRYWADLKHKQILWVLTLCSPVITPSPSAQPMGPAQGPRPWVQPIGPAHGSSPAFPVCRDLSITC